MRKHHFHHAAGFDRLFGIAVARPRELVAAEHAAGHLAILRVERVPVGVRDLEVSWILVLLIENRGLAETLADLHVVAAADPVHPLLSGAHEFLAKLQQLGVTRAAVKPVNHVHVVAVARHSPAAPEELRVVERQLIVEEPLHQLENARVTTVLIVKTVGVEHVEVGHEIRLLPVESGKRLRSEVAVGPLPGQRRLQPCLGLGHQRGIAEQEGGGGVAAQPIRNLFPEAIALARGIQPGVVVLLEESADLAEVAVETVGLQPQLSMQPTLRFDRAQRQADERAGK